MARAKIQLKGQFVVQRDSNESLSQQIVRQLQQAIRGGRLPQGARLPSTRALAGALGVSRNTVLAAYDELAARGFVRGRRGAGMYVAVLPAIASVSMKAVMRDAQFPLRTISFSDEDGNPLTVSY